MHGVEQMKLYQLIKQQLHVNMIYVIKTKLDVTHWEWC
jgi:GTP1/Obg family GTP-binding protein